MGIKTSYIPQQFPEYILNFCTVIESKMINAFERGHTCMVESVPGYDKDVHDVTTKSLIVNVRDI